MSLDKKSFERRLGDTIAYYRQRAKLTQEELAERLEIGNEAVSRMERGLVPPSLFRLIQLAEIFHCQVSELLDRNSRRAEDQGVYLTQLLQQLTPSEQQTIIDIVEKLTAHFIKTKS